MTKTKSALKSILFIFICGFCFFLFSCGLESITYLDPPVGDGHTPSLDDSTNAFFSFRTADSENSSADGVNNFIYLGTAVYYKIYGNYDSLLSEQSSIDTINSSSTTNNAASALKNTYKFKPFKLKASSPDVLISKDYSAEFVYIRPNDLIGGSGIDANFPADVRIDSTRMINSTTGTSIGFPMRNTPQTNGFDFGASGGGSFGCVKSDLPVESDEDVKGTAQESGVWYVAAYAFSAGRDGSFQDSFSKVLYLGAIKIKAEDYNNK